MLIFALLELGFGMLESLHLVRDRISKRNDIEKAQQLYNWYGLFKQVVAAGEKIIDLIESYTLDDKKDEAIIVSILNLLTIQKRQLIQLVFLSDNLKAWANIVLDTTGLWTLVDEKSGSLDDLIADFRFVLEHPKHDATSVVDSLRGYIEKGDGKRRVSELRNLQNQLQDGLSRLPPEILLKIEDHTETDLSIY